MLPLVVIAGRPNVGKSTLFNRLAGRRLALVADTPGVTRDRKEAEALLRGRLVRLVDTAGLEEAAPETLAGRMREGSGVATAAADLVVFVVDARTGRDAGRPPLRPVAAAAGTPGAAGGEQGGGAVGAVLGAGRVRTGVWRTGRCLGRARRGDLGADERDRRPAAGAGEIRRTSGGGRTAAEAGHRGAAERWEVHAAEPADRRGADADRAGAGADAGCGLGGAGGSWAGRSNWSTPPDCGGRRGSRRRWRSWRWARRSVR